MALMSDVERILGAVVAISSDLDLSAVLRRIVSAACDLELTEGSG